ncbi:TetR/AcrR family transcriptional regulator [Arvimicrobium flavum]|uniref:TetR/AcrR family transcriptional regulator n=1 Tax=Arvimicrobium flavum TaxID=3393320 RepID=UPI00237AA5CC|nr:TetR/AcrR family transcriptional regulator [Mesorhizobium shangrilense]
MKPATKSGPKTPVRRAEARQAKLRENILAAARDLFVAKGYSGTSIADITEQIGVSVGSLYYHYPSKADVFTALWEQYGERQVEATRSTIVAFRSVGIDDGVKLFLAGTRAYLVSAWENRIAIQLFYGDDVPAGFSRVFRKGPNWLRQNQRLLEGLGASHIRAITAILTGSMSENVRQVAGYETLQEAEVYINAVIDIFAHIAEFRTASHAVGKEPITAGESLEDL